MMNSSRRRRDLGADDNNGVDLVVHEEDKRGIGAYGRSTIGKNNSGSVSRVESGTADASRYGLHMKKVIFVIGVRGSGKRTQCQYLINELSLPALFTEELLLVESRRHTQNGRVLSELIQQGQLVPSAIIVRVLCQALASYKQRMVLICGFPRNLEDWETWKFVTTLSSGCAGTIAFVNASHKHIPPILSGAIVSPSAARSRRAAASTPSKVGLSFNTNTASPVSHSHSRTRVQMLDSSDGVGLPLSTTEVAATTTTTTTTTTTAATATATATSTSAANSTSGGDGVIEGSLSKGGKVGDPLPSWSIPCRTLAAIYLQCDQQIVVARLTKRMRRGSTPWHPDDARQEFLNFHQQVAPVLGALRRDKILHVIGASEDYSIVYMDVWKQVIPIIESHVGELTKVLLDAVHHSDWTTYKRLVDKSLTAFEEEAQGHIVCGLDFHKFYFRNKHHYGHSTFAGRPEVRVIGRSCIVAYVRLCQSVDPRTGDPRTDAFEETRVFANGPGGWKMVHFHRSRAPTHPEVTTK